VTTFQCGQWIYTDDERKEVASGTSFEAFVEERAAGLVRSTALMTGDRFAAEDLVQSALLKAWRVWWRVASSERPEAYVKKMVVNEFLKSKQKRANSEVITDSLAVEAAAQTFDVVDRAWIGDALQRLTPRQRACVVLRYFDDLSERDTAELMKCSVGTVKSQTSRALSALRVLLSPEESNT
jgi:RNA polymerase sigma-70 factor (sigma-E family)